MIPNFVQKICSVGPLIFNLGLVSIVEWIVQVIAAVVGISIWLNAVTLP